MSNFDFLREYDYDLWNWADKLEHDLILSPASAVTYATRFLERVLELLIVETGTKVDSSKKYYYKLDAVYRESDMSYGFKKSIYDAYQMRSKIHVTSSREMDKSEIPIAKQLHKRLYIIAKKLYRDYYDDYDENIGVPEFKPVEVDTSADEVDLLDIPDFSEILESGYDYCIICGKPNHSNYSLCCPECNRVMDNANNFISIRNNFGKTARFTKEDLIEFGIPEGYVNRLINSLVRENMFKVAGRYITFNNIGLDDYLAKIDNYINVCELITKFREDKITASEIKSTREYKQGSLKNEPFYQFYKITNREIIKKFERDLLTTEDIWKSITYTAISENQLERWYKRELGNYRRGKVNRSFAMFNDLLKRDYLDLKREGTSDTEIRSKLNVTDEIYEFWQADDEEFIGEIDEIKIGLLSNAIREGKTRPEIIAAAGVTQKEYDDLVKVANFHDNDFARIRNSEIESRKKAFLKFLKGNDLNSSCHLAKFTLDDFYEYYNTSGETSEFYTATTKILMDKFLAQRRLGKSRDKATEFIGIKDKYVQRWLSRSAYTDFRKDELEITVNLIIRGFKNNLTLDEIAEISGISVEGIERSLRVGARGDETFRPLFEYYENNIIPKKLEDFIIANETKTIRKALESAHLKQGELDKYYELGKNGDECFAEFYEKFLDIKKGTYVYISYKGKSHDIAMRESQLTEEEYGESLEELTYWIRELKFSIVYEALRDRKTSNVIAKRANCTVEDLYDWYFKGKEGDEDYREFYERFHHEYVNASVVPMQEKIDNENANIDVLIRSNKDKFTRKDVEIWIRNGLIDPKISIESKRDNDEEKDEEKPKKGKVKKVNIGKVKKSADKRSSLGRINDTSYDVEELKRQILRK